MMGLHHDVPILDIDPNGSETDGAERMAPIYLPMIGASVEKSSEKIHRRNVKVVHTPFSAPDQRPQNHAMVLHSS